MNATDELRRLLDERGVEWKEHRHVMPGSMAIQLETLWGQPTDVSSGKPIPHVYHCRATEMGDGRLFLEAQLITPEQAIAATLGSCNCSNDCTNSERTETCRRVRGRKSYRAYGGYRIECSACGYGLADKRYRFCPNCGRKVVDE